MHHKEWNFVEMSKKENRKQKKTKEKTPPLDQGKQCYHISWWKLTKSGSE